MHTHFGIFLWDGLQILVELGILRKVRTAAEPRSIVGVSVLDEFVEMVVSISSKGSLMEVSQAERRLLPSWFRIEGPGKQDNEQSNCWIGGVEEHCQFHDHDLGVSRRL